MIINYNVSSMIANNALTRSDSALAKSLERLSSGYKINHAKDNASSLAIARRMNAQLKSLSVASDNVNDGISVVEIADGALSEVHDILQRMNELTIKASNGTLCDDDRKMIDDEFQALADEIERVGSTTQYNGKNLLDGSFALKGYTNTQTISVDYYQEGITYGNYELEPMRVTFNDAGEITEVTSIHKYPSPNDNKYMPVSSITNKDQGKDIPVEVSYQYDEVTITGSDGMQIKMTLKKDLANNDSWHDVGNNTYIVGSKHELDASNNDVYTGVTFELSGIGSLTLQVGANEDQTLDVCIPPITRKHLDLAHANVKTEASSLEATDKIAAAISTVSAIRSTFGAYQNRLEHTASNLDMTSENVTNAYSRIMDVDMAEEMTNYSSYQVISQAATAMLAQANERPSQVLQLLQ